MKLLSLVLGLFYFGATMCAQLEQDSQEQRLPFIERVSVSMDKVGIELNEELFEIKVNEYVDSTITNLINNRLSTEDDEYKKISAYLKDFKIIVAGITDRTTMVALYNILSSGNSLCRKASSLKGPMAVLGQELRKLLLIKASPLLIKKLRAEIILSIDILRLRLHYWIQQDAHNVYYFFHKSPLKWFSGLSQHEEIKNSIEQVRIVQEQYYGLLGSVVSRIHSFDSAEDISNQDAWLEDLLVITQHALSIKDTVLPLNEVDSVKRGMIFIRALSEHAQVPELPGAYDGHLVRNWMTYSAVSMATITALVMGYKNAHKFPEWKEKISNDLAPYSNHVKIAGKAVHKFFLPEGETLNDQGLKAKLETFHEAVARLPGVSIASSGDAVALDQLVIPSLKSLQKEVVEHHQWKSVGKLWSIVNQLDTAMGISVIDGISGWFGGGGVKEAIKFGPAYIEGVKATWPLVVRYLTKLEQKISLLLVGGVGSIAAVVTYTALQKAYNTLKPSAHGFKLAKDSLLNISRILNAYDSAAAAVNITNADWGKLLYSLDRIAKEVQYVPEIDKLPFFADVEQLGFGSPLNVHQKLELIKIMLQQYSFLKDDTMALLCAR
jgi:hypothetical protein